LLTAKTKATAPPPQNCQCGHPCEVKSVLPIMVPVWAGGRGGKILNHHAPSFIHWTYHYHPHSLMKPVIAILLQNCDLSLSSIPSFMRGPITAILHLFKRPITTIFLSFMERTNPCHPSFIHERTNHRHPSFIHGSIIAILLLFIVRTNLAILLSFLVRTHPCHPSSMHGP
jgi:hypothetical protein